jgi:glycosyltransferase involved in cell wall biosynthesis
LANNPWLYLLIPPFLLSMAWSVWRAARNADVVHANWAVCGCIAGLAGRARGVPVVTTLRGEDVTRAQRRWIEAAILSWCLHFSMRVVTVSQAFESWLREQFDRFAHKISVIENGVDAQFLRCGEQRTQSRSDSLRLVIIGSLIRRKAVDQAIRALALIADEPSHVSLTIIGSGPEEQHLRDLAVSLGISKQVTFRGHLAPDKVAEMLLAFDVFVLTSLSEGRPNVVLEAMATGLPVIASDIDGVRELITDEQTGLLYRSGETQELAERIRLLQADPSLRARLGKAAHEHIVARGLIWPRTAERYRALYADIVSG